MVHQSSSALAVGRIRSRAVADFTFRSSQRRRDNPRRRFQAWALCRVSVAKYTETIVMSARAIM